MGPEYLVSATGGDPAGGVLLRMIPMGLGIRSNCKGPKADHRGGGDDCKGNTAKPGHREGGGDGNGKGKAGYPQEAQPCTAQQAVLSPNCDWWPGWRQKYDLGKGWKGHSSRTSWEDGHRGDGVAGSPCDSWNKWGGDP